MAKKKSKAWRAAKARRNEYKRQWAERAEKSFAEYTHPNESTIIKILKKIQRWQR